MTTNLDFRNPAMPSRDPDLPWLLPALALTAAHVGAVLLGLAPPLSTVLLLAMAASWLVFSYRFLGRAPAESPAEHAMLLGEEQKLMAELREFVAREVEGTRGEIERTRTLVSAAVADLNKAFAEMEGESRVQGATITNLVERENLGEAGSPGMRQFASASGQLMDDLTGALAEGSRESVVTVGKMDQMVAHLDAVFEGLNDAQLRERIAEARQLVTAVREQVEQIAEREMDKSVEAKIKADGLKEQVERVNRSLADGMRTVSGAGKRIHDSVGTAVRSLQFEDIAGQALTAANVHLERLQAINRDATQLQNVLTAANVTPDARLRAMEDFLRHIKEVRDSWVKPAHKPVAQVDLKSGTVELF